MPDEHHHHHHEVKVSFDLSSGVRELAEFFCRINAKLDCLHEQGEQIMATVQSFQALLTDMNTVTNTIAANIAALLERLNQAGISAAEEQAIQDQLTAQVEALRAVAASSAQPVPPVPVVTPTP